MDESITCSLVYAALFQAAKNAQHDGMLSYSKPRLRAVLPYVETIQDNPKAKEKLKDIATRLEHEVKDTFIKQATNAIHEEDPQKLKSLFTRVIQCDKAFDIATFPIPLKQAPTWNRFLKGFYEGCLSKQRKSASPFPDAQIQAYCKCMTNKAAAKGVDGYTSEETIDTIVSQSHPVCFAPLQ